MDKNFYSYLGLCHRAGRLVSGETAQQAMKNGTAKLVIIAEDASENTKKKMKNTGSYYHVPVYEAGTILELGHAIGKPARAVLAVTDSGFSKRFEEMLAQKAGESM